MTFRFRIKTLVSSAGETVVLPASGVTCIVGGNNEGKSQLLRDIRVQSRGPEGGRGSSGVETRTLSSATFDTPAVESVEMLASWLHENTRAHKDDGRLIFTPHWAESRNDIDFIAHQLRSSRAVTGGHAGMAVDYFVRLVKAGALADYAAGSANRSSPYAAQPLLQPLLNGKIEKALSDLTDAAFGQKLILDRNPFELKIRVGTVDVPVPLQNDPSIEYSEAVSALPTLEEQGDGMKSFLGLALMILAEKPNVLLIDEPEVFLHPAQSRALGRWLSQEATVRNIQIVLSTHDRDMVLGVLESAPEGQVNIVRITRDGALSHLTQLTALDIEAVWDDPVLRYSNVLQGLFHKRVVICEADADCRFFGAALDQLGLRTNSRATSDEVLFVPAGGKGGIAAIATALGKLGVQTRVIADFDVLFDKRQLKQILVSLGSVYSPEIEGTHKIILDAINSHRFSTDDLKKRGLGLLEGPELVAGESLLERLAACGLLVTPAGEMEGFDKRLTHQKAAWVSEALRNDVHTSSQVATFVAHLLNDIDAPQPGLAVQVRGL